MRLAHAVCVFTALSLATLVIDAQQPPAPTGAAGPPTGGPLAALANLTQFDQTAVERGRDLLVARCGFCHGANARGGQRGPDLTRSALVQDDEGGTQLGELLRVGRP